MFKREHHLRIATILQSLDAEQLAANGCYFGGGTAIVLSRGEYCESLDIDFLISNKVGFRTLRNSLTSRRDLSAIVRKGAQLTLARDIRADQYGIRTKLELQSKLRKAAVLKAEAAYGDAVVRDLKKAIAELQSRPGKLTECMASLKMNGIPEAVLWRNIRNLNKLK